MHPVKQWRRGLHQGLLLANSQSGCRELNVLVRRLVNGVMPPYASKKKKPSLVPAEQTAPTPNGKHSTDHSAPPPNGKATTEQTVPILNGKTTTAQPAPDINAKPVTEIRPNSEGKAAPEQTVLDSKGEPRIEVQPVLNGKVEGEIPEVAIDTEPAKLNGNGKAPVAVM